MEEDPTRPKVEEVGEEEAILARSCVCVDVGTR